MLRADKAVSAAGLRIGARTSVELAGDRIQRQPSTAAVWLELDADGGGAMDDLLTIVNRDFGDGRYAAVVSTTADLLDRVAARVESGEVELIVNASDSERATALAVALSALPLKISDVASDNNAERLQQLSEEVSRIASTLARLSTGLGSATRPMEPAAVGDPPRLSAQTVKAVIRARRARARYFPEEFFADPAWDMLLDLLRAEIEQLRVPVSSLCIAAAVPATTALRWLKAMVSKGIFIRPPDLHDDRRVHVELAPEASHAMRRYFAEVGTVTVI